MESVGPELSRDSSHRMSPTLRRFPTAQAVQKEDPFYESGHESHVKQLLQRNDYTDFILQVGEKKAHNGVG